MASATIYTKNINKHTNTNNNTDNTDRITRGRTYVNIGRPCSVGGGGGGEGREGGRGAGGMEEVRMDKGTSETIVVAELASSRPRNTRT